jgi:hypothetical protein
MIFLIAGRGSNKPFRDFEVFLEKLTEVIHNLTEPFQRLADAIKELNTSVSKIQNTSREYFLKKHQIHPQRYTPRSYNYIPMRQKNLPYQRRIY